jgi:hypothetical protein
VFSGKFTPRRVQPSGLLLIAAVQHSTIKVDENVSERPILLKNSVSGDGEKFSGR